MKLKTLKDLHKDWFDQFELPWDKFVKKEAIKWVKDNFRMKRKDIAQMFMIFFNITEEDLKS